MTVWKAGKHGDGRFRPAIPFHTCVHDYRNDRGGVSWILQF